MSKKTKYYVVWEGHHPGVYTTWDACLDQVKNFPNAKYKAFTSYDEAMEAFHSPVSKNWGVGGIKKTTNSKIKSNPNINIIKDSISVDAACSGNPGNMEYRGVHTSTGEQLFHKGPFKDGTNNVGEFLALVHALAAYHDSHKPITIYSDSKTAMAWVRNKKAKTTLTLTKNNAQIFDLITRAENWLNQNKSPHKILKWDTENWGEIPADFGRK